MCPYLAWCSCFCWCTHPSDGRPGRLQPTFTITFFFFWCAPLHASTATGCLRSCPPLLLLSSCTVALGSDRLSHATIAQLTRRTVEVLCRLASGSIYTSSVMKYNAFQHFTKYLEKIIKTQLKTSAAILFERLPIYNSSCMLYSGCSAGGPTDLHT